MTKFAHSKSKQGLSTCISRTLRKKLPPSVCRRLLLEYPFWLKKVIMLKGEQIPNAWDLRQEFKQFDTVCNNVETKFQSFENQV